MIAVLLGNAPEASLVPHEKALLDGTLGKILNYHLKGKPIKSLIEEKGTQEQFNAFKKRYNAINSQPATEEKIEAALTSNIKNG
ncbi:MAG: hypothetical protein H0U57_07885 [Tatlockia sp.]|nr:hypothetical protein [Tatlockia sp.]